MNGKRIRPKWWQLYLSNIFILALFWIEDNATYSDAVHVLMEAALIFLLFGSMMLWLTFNKEAFRSNFQNP